jgi:outer membrane protein OmpA-like peptidoglycan-associated protein
MRILITGFVVFVIWCFISAWLFNDILLPATKKPVPVLTIPDSQTNEADSLMKLKASMPKKLLIYFEFNDSEFKPDPQIDIRIADFKAWLDKYPASGLSVTGFSDLVGTTEFNLALGLKRARVVSKYIESRGINAGKMLTETRGENDPIGDYLSAEGRAKNRRTEISIKMQ